MAADVKWALGPSSAQPRRRRRRTDHANGTGFRDGETFRWSANGSVMTVVNAQGMAQIPYRLRKDQLIVVLDGKQLTLQRAGKGAPAGARPSAATRALAGAGRRGACGSSSRNPPQLPQLTEVRINVKRNSNGRPFIVADGVEYVQCR